MSLDLDHFRRLLQEQREQLNANAAERERQAATVDLDQQRVGRLSRMDALQMQAMAKAEQQRAVAQLKRIAAALRRIDSGDFGYCAACDEAIAPARLEFDPATPLCIDCAERT